MLSRLKEKEEKIQLILEYLAEESEKGTPIIVEGIKDQKALKTLGIEGKIILAKAGGKNIHDVIMEIEECQSREVILLLDFDRRGREWTRRLRQRLERTGTRPNIEYWNQLLQLVWREVKDIEGLASYMETLKRKLSSQA
ncbi:toprim domain-containing protein [Candidatus Bathyarchaeota archaeon]|nr:toprim domain-containing protein [Candidatus Bathyarchaeota archaeon]